MAECYSREYKRKLHGERMVLMLPLNVVMAARITGFVDGDRLKSAVDRLRRRHALLGVKAELDNDKACWLKADGVPENPVQIVPRSSADQWQNAATEEMKRPFRIFEGPLVRFTLIQSHDVSELLVTAHHAVCDGISLSYLIRDILQLINDPSAEAEVLPGPPPIDKNTVANPPRLNPIAGFMVKLLNKKWDKKGIEFGQEDLDILYRTFFERNSDVRILTWELPKPEVETLITRSRLGKVTVNTSLTTALVRAQAEMQGDKEPFRQSIGMASDIRSKLTVPVGEQLAFFAASFVAKLKNSKKSTFWGMAKEMHSRIKSALEKNDPFKMLISDYLHPTLQDSLYFSKYGIRSEGFSNKLLKKMKWDRLSNGYAITNVGKLDIPTSYGGLKLDAVFGPLVYSDVNEKTVGIATAGEFLTLSIVYCGSIVPHNVAEILKNTFVNHITSALK